LCELEEKTRKEAARQLGVPEGTLAAWVARGRALLAKRLARHGLAVSSGVWAAVSQQAASACVPTALAFSTIKAAGASAAGQAATAGLISAEVVALAEGVIKAMFLTKLKTVAVVLFATAVLGVAAGALAGNVKVQRADEAKADEKPKTDKDKLQGSWAVVA